MNKKGDNMDRPHSLMTNRDITEKDAEMGMFEHTSFTTGEVIRTATSYNYFKYRGAYIMKHYNTHSTPHVSMSFTAFHERGNVAA